MNKQMKTKNIIILLAVIIIFYMASCTKGKNVDEIKNEKETSVEKISEDVNSTSSLLDSETLSEENIVLTKTVENQDNLITPESKDADNALYIKSIMNLSNGNCITYDNGWYYYRSQTDEYSLYKIDTEGKNPQKLADEIPGSIYIDGNQVYFTNISDGCKLYQVKTDGTDLTKIADVAMQRLIVVKDKVYYQSKYNPEYDSNNILIGDPKEDDDNYVYSMNLDGTEKALLLSDVCYALATDGNCLYYTMRNSKTEDYESYRSDMMGKNEERISVSDGYYDVIPYGKHLYFTNNDTLYRTEKDGTQQEQLLYDVDKFIIYNNTIYAANYATVRKMSLGKNDLSTVCTFRGIDDDCFIHGAFNRGIYFANGKLFIKYFESEDKGVLWHGLDEEQAALVVVEDIKPIDSSELVARSSLDSDAYFPFENEQNISGYMSEDLIFEDACGVNENGDAYGRFEIHLPQFNNKIEGYQAINKTLKSVYKSELKGKEDYYEEIKEGIKSGEVGSNYFKGVYYYSVTVTNKYVSVYIDRQGYSGGIRGWEDLIPMTFDRRTGALLKMDDLFCVNRIHYMKKMTAAIYKYMEMRRLDIDLYGYFLDSNPLVTEFKEDAFILTDTGILICYESYTFLQGAAGAPKFEIPYKYINDILKQ